LPYLIIVTNSTKPTHYRMGRQFAICYYAVHRRGITVVEIKVIKLCTGYKKSTNIKRRVGK